MSGLVDTPNDVVRPISARFLASLQPLLLMNIPSSLNLLSAERRGLALETNTANVTYRGKSLVVKRARSVTLILWLKL